MTPDEFIQKLIELLGVPPEIASDPGALLAAIEERMKTEDPEETPAAKPEGEQEAAMKSGTPALVATLSTRLANLENVIATRNANDLLTEFADRLTPQTREAFQTLAMSNPAQARVILSGMPVMVEPAKNGKQAASDVSLTPEEIRVAASLGLDPKDVLATKTAEVTNG